MTRLHSLKMENEQRWGTREEVGEVHASDEASRLSDDIDELTIDIPRLLGEGGATKRMALPDGETVVVTFRMPSNDSGFRGSRPSSLVRKRYETIDEERESVTDSDKSSHLGENGTTADNELSDDSIKERQRLRLGSGRFSRRKRSFEQPLLTSRYDRGEKDEFNILDDEEGKDIDDASSDTGFEPQDNGAMLRSWGIKPRISRWSDCMDLSELTSSPTEDHSDGNLLSSVGSPCRDSVDLDLEKATIPTTTTITTVTSVKMNTPPVTIQCVIDETSDINQNTSKVQPNLYNIPPITTVEADFDSDPTSLESSNKRQSFEACDLRWKADGTKYLKLPMSGSGTFRSSKPTDIDAASKEMTKPISHSRMIYEFLEANYSRSLPFLSAKGKPTDIDSVSSQLLTLSTDEIEGGLMHGLRCSSSPSIPNCKASDIFQFARPDSSECYFQGGPEPPVKSGPLLTLPGSFPHLRQGPEGFNSSMEGSISSIDNKLSDTPVTPSEPKTSLAPTGLILQPQEYIKSGSTKKVTTPSPLPTPTENTSTPSQVKPTQFPSRPSIPTMGTTSLMRSTSLQSPHENSASSGKSRSYPKSHHHSRESLVKSKSLETDMLPSMNRASPVSDSHSPTVFKIASMDSLSDGSLNLSDIDVPRGNKDNKRVMGKTESKNELSRPLRLEGTSPAERPNTSNTMLTKDDQRPSNKATEAKDGLRDSSGTSADYPDYMDGSSKAQGERDPGDGAWDYPSLIEKTEGASLLNPTNDEEEENSGEYTSCDEISLLADDHVYASNERVNSDFDDEDDEEEEAEISDEFASETFTELEKLADVGSIDNLMDDVCGTPDGSDLPLDQPEVGKGRGTPDSYLNVHPQKDSLHAKPKGNSQRYFTDAKMSNAEEAIEKWQAKHFSPRDKKLTKPTNSRFSIPKPVASSTSYVQSSRRETTFLPDSHKCVSESTLGDAIISGSGSGSAASKSAAKPTAPKTTTTAPPTKGATSLPRSKIPPAPARGGNFAGVGSISSQASNRSSLIARPVTGPQTRQTKGPGMRGRPAGASSTYTKSSYQSSTPADNKKDPTTPKSSYAKQQDINSAKYRSSSTSSANGTVANRKKPGSSMERVVLGAPAQAKPKPQQQQATGNKFGAKSQVGLKAQTRGKSQQGGQSESKGHTGNIMQLGNKLKAAAAQAVPKVVSKVGSGPHHVHGATAGQLDMTPRTARRLTSRVTTI